MCVCMCVGMSKGKRLSEWVVGGGASGQLTEVCTRVCACMDVVLYVCKGSFTQYLAKYGFEA